MFSMNRLVPRASAAALTVLAGSILVGCAHVKQEDMDASMARLESQLRQEMSAGDAALGNRIDEMDGRVSDLEVRTDRLESELDRLSQEFDATVERLANAVRFNAPIHFGFDEAELSGPQMQMLDRFASVVNQYYPDYVITVEGFTDAVGTPEYNQDLGMRRANSVKTYLTSQGGLDAARVRAVSYGESGARLVAPQAHGPGEDGVENRRVSMVVEYVSQ